MELTFLGATGTVTGSKYLVRRGARKVLVDCGLFQGFKQLRLRNWSPLPVDASEIDAVVLTHAHIDHSGYLPLLVKNGFSGKVHCTEATRDLCALLLADSGRLQEEEADYANRRGYSKHRPALPLYTEADGELAVAHFEPVEFGRELELGADLKARLLPSGHLLGSAIVHLSDGRSRAVFTGDLGRPSDPLLKPPATVREADYLVVESTYGNRRHDPTNPQSVLGEVIRRTAQRGGVLVIPAFSVGRAQTLLYFIHRLKAERAIPDLPVYLNSPMAARANAVYQRFRADHQLTEQQCEALCSTAKVVTTVDESKALNQRKGPMVIIAGSGMATGGRVVHHLKAFAPDPRNTVLFAGFQAGGTRGAAMVAGAKEVKIHGDYVPVRAEVAHIDNLSAHADADEILAWLGAFSTPPRRTFITHGEPSAASALKLRVEQELGWSCEVPEYLETVALG